MLKKHNKHLSRQNGQALVEFALVLPIVVIMVMAILEFGRLWMTLNVLTGAAREGVRVAAVTAPDQGLVQNAVQNVMNGANIQNFTITTAGPDGANQVTVTVQMNYTVLTGSILPGISDTMQLTRNSTMRWEG